MCKGESDRWSEPQLDSMQNHQQVRVSSCKSAMQASAAGVPNVSAATEYSVRCPAGLCPSFTMQ